MRILIDEDTAVQRGSSAAACARYRAKDCGWRCAKLSSPGRCTCRPSPAAQRRPSEPGRYAGCAAREESGENGVPNPPSRRGRAAARSGGGGAVSIGEALAAARRQADLTITQVSQRTRIRETIIRGIEGDDFSACGADFYARGHIRAIARAAGADPEPLVREYDSSHGPPQASTAGGISAPSAALRLRERRRPNWGVALLVVLAAVAGLVTYHVVASGPATSGTAAARRPVTAHKAARRHPAATSTPSPPAARRGPRDVVISLRGGANPAGPTSPHRAARRSSRASSTRVPRRPGRNGGQSP